MPIKVNYLKEFKLIVGANNCISDQSIIKKIVMRYLTISLNLFVTIFFLTNFLKARSLLAES